MRLDFFTNLPSEITTNILSRLPLRSVGMSKCVCKAWLHLLESDYFVKSHLSKTRTPPALALLMLGRHSTRRCTVLELVDEIEVNLESHDRHYKLLTKFDFPKRYSSIVGSANGFLLLFSRRETLYVCNPLTRDYVDLCFPQEFISACGFGVSKTSGKHKVVCINRGPKSDSHHVYTLETGIWRRVEADAVFGYDFYRAYHGIFVNGNLHWTVEDSNGTERICGFDLENECFSIFSSPPEAVDEEYSICNTLSVISDCLCVCCRTWDDNIVIWLMKEYGVEKSWTKEYVIPIIPDSDFDRNVYLSVYPIKVFKDDDILILWCTNLLIYFSNKTKTIQEVDMFNDATAENYRIYPMIHTPSLLSLKSFGMENVISF